MWKRSNITPIISPICTGEGCSGVRLVETYDDLWFKNGAYGRYLRNLGRYAALYAQQSKTRQR